MGCSSSSLDTAPAPSAASLDARDARRMSREWDGLAAPDTNPDDRRDAATPPPTDGRRTVRAMPARASDLESFGGDDNDDARSAASATELMLSDLVGIPAPCLVGSTTISPRAASLSHSDAVLHRSQHLHSPRPHPTQQEQQQRHAASSGSGRRRSLSQSTGEACPRPPSGQGTGSLGDAAAGPNSGNPFVVAPAAAEDNQRECRHSSPARGGGDCESTT